MGRVFVCLLLFAVPDNKDNVPFWSKKMAKFVRNSFKRLRFPQLYANQPHTTSTQASMTHSCVMCGAKGTDTHRKLMFLAVPFSPFLCGGCVCVCKRERYKYLSLNVDIFADGPSTKVSTVK